MLHRRLLWLVFVPLSAVGGFLAHVAAHGLLVSPPAGHGAHAHHAGHHEVATAAASLGHWRVCALVSASVVALALLAALVDRRRTRLVQPPLWAIALLPPAGFGLQEHLARWLDVGAFPAGAAVETTFLVGLALQIPVALAAVLLARTLLRTVAALGRMLSERPRVRLAGAEPPWQPVARDAATTLLLLAPGLRERGPPALRTL